jgi:3-hydroxyacyl-CoA dehydrogenase
VVSTALRFAKTLRKTPVLVRNREGFLVNRIFVPYLNEAFRLLQDGADADGIDQAMVAFGFPMGPLTLIDMAGIDILARAGAALSRAFPRHGPIPPIATALVAAGRVGQKAGAGIYRYDPGDRTPRPCAEARAIIARAREQAGRPTPAPGADEITRRLVLRMVVEAFDALDEGLVQRESDVDAALVLGVGFPDFRGGVLKYARDRGLPAVLRELESLADRWGERFAPGALLRKKGAS